MELAAFNLAQKKQTIEIHPVYWDNHLLVLMKPPGISTQPHPGASSGSNALDWAKGWLKRKLNKPGNVFLEPIHRLDQAVGGLVLCARTSKALSRLSQMMRERKIEKYYIAAIEGYLPQEEGVLEHYLLHGDRKACIVSSQTSGAKWASLRYRLLKRFTDHSYVEIQLETGRYHQIRAQCAAVGCPVIGDRKYGSTYPFAKEGIALFHHQLRFKHPVTQESMHFESSIIPW